MNEPLSLVFALLAGMVLGAIFFGGLWWTVQRGVVSTRPALWFLSSLLLRTCIVVLGFYFILGDQWQKLLAGLLGFILARLIVTWVTRGLPRRVHQPNSLAQKAGHAP